MTTGMWQLGSEPGFSLDHRQVAAGLASWGGGLDYRVGRQGHRQDLEPGLETPELDANQVRVRVEGDGLRTVLAFDLAGPVRIDGSVTNLSSADLALERLVLRVDRVGLGGAQGRLSFLKNGYQSWTETRPFLAPDRAKLPIMEWMSALQDNLRNLASGRVGEFTSDMFSVLGNLDDRCFLLAGQAQGFHQFVTVRATLPRRRGGGLPRLELVYDFGGQVLPPGGTVALDAVVILAGEHANRLQDRYFDRVQPGELRPLDQPLPTGWCSWYYYFTRVTGEDVRENLQVARRQGVDWQVFVLDDGYQTAVGDWLSVNDKFPAGLDSIAGEIRTAGMGPGLWLAPFVARRDSALYREHPDWALQDQNGRPVRAGWNPNWGVGGVFYGLDTTHPGFQAYLRQVVDTVVHRWGFKYLKLDFTYGACLYGRAHDRSLTPAQRLRLGYRIVREVAGEDVFVLGCGSPLSAAVGLVDGLRIGPDVAPYWFDRLRVHLTRDPHALCTKFAIRSILHRCQMHRRLWINDPDCLLLRDSHTRLTPAERLSLVNAVVITGGMALVSDRLAGFSPAIWRQVAAIEGLVRECDAGRAWALDTMEREMPEVVYNSAGYLAVFNFQDRATRKRVALWPYLEGVIPGVACFTDVWTGESFTLADGVLDVGEVPAHGSCLCRVYPTGSPAISFPLPPN